MFLQAASVFLLGISAAASPTLISRSPVTIPMARRMNHTGAANFAKFDQARAKALHTKALATGYTDEVPAINTLVTYTATVAIGSPPHPYTLLVDTGSSNTWVNARPLDNPYRFTSTSVPYLLSNLLDAAVSVTYGSGSFTGLLYSDVVTVGDLPIPHQVIGVAALSRGFTDVDGILGLGPTGLTRGTITLAGNSLIPTVTDNLFANGDLATKEIGIFFDPASETVAGEITFGGTDPSKYNGPINYVPITSTPLASSYVGINQAIRYGSTPILQNTSAGIVDTGTTLTLLPSDTLAAYAQMTGAVMDPTTGLLRLTLPQFANLKSMYFTIGGTDYELIPNAQIWPRSMYAAFGGTADFVYLIFGDIGRDSGSGFDFINGLTFLERYYTVYDSETPRFGIAPTAFTYSQDN